jgi:hypothetical protein
MYSGCVYGVYPRSGKVLPPTIPGVAFVADLFGLHQHLDDSAGISRTRVDEADVSRRLTSIDSLGLGTYRSVELDMNQRLKLNGA